MVYYQRFHTNQYEYKVIGKAMFEQKDAMEISLRLFLFAKIRAPPLFLRK